ncbi:PaaI family thioesterase [Cupriavidus sp. 2TAF22]|uniref:PaaI family thioesterase n=1 Tax=unclassified Cupriavidus TaxID=2640874 RepID=UPI003F8F6097
MSILVTALSSAAGTAAAPVDPRIRQFVEQVLMGSPVARSLGIALDVLAVDHVELVLPFSPANITVGEIVHGGVIATLIDVTGAAAAVSGCDGEHLRGGATGSLNIQYLEAARAANLRAVASVIRRGRRQVVTEVSLYAEGANEGELVAKALMSTTLF